MKYVLFLYVAGGANLIVMIASLGLLHTIPQRYWDRLPEWWQGTLRISWVWQMSVVSVMLTSVLYRWFNTP